VRAVQGFDDTACWLLLHRAPGLGGQSVKALLEQFPTACDVVQAAQERRPDLRACTREFLQSADAPVVAPERDWLEQPGHHLVTLADPRYPRLLGEIADPPVLVFVNGDPDVLSLPQLAMVGSRHPTPAGAEAAYAFAQYLNGLGLTITSGLALGIDGASHRGALAGGGRTLAVVGTGLDRVYPAGHRDLAHRIAETGALVSEYTLGTPPRAGNFPRRNRLIAGLSLGTLVVEAAENSGSLITARLAAEEGREVFAIPGSIHNPLARGCHALIRQGAKLVERGADVLEELAPHLSVGFRPAGDDSDARDRSQAPRPDDLDPDYQRLLTYMGYDPVSVDLLVERSALTPEAVSSMLLILELRGYIAAHAGGVYVRLSREFGDE
jgi:DNA processing protein